MVSIRRFVDRFFALSLAVSPLWTTLTPTVGYSTAWGWAVGSLAVAAVALVLYGPSHDSNEAWRFGFVTLLVDVTLSLPIEHGFDYQLDANPGVGVLVWLVALGVAFAHVARRRSRAQDTSRR